MYLSQCCSHGLHLPQLLSNAVAVGDKPNFSLTFLSRPSSSHSVSRTPTRPSKSLTRFSKPDTQLASQSAIQRIAEKLRSLGYGEEEESPIAREPGPESEPGKIFIPLPDRLPKVRIGHTIDTSWSTPENPVPAPGSSSFMVGYNRMRREVKEMKRKVGKEESVENVPTLAELRLPEDELRRLRGLGIRMKKKLKIGKAGITEGVVNGIHERWRNAEVLRITCEDLCRRNMKRTHDLLERITGGLVVWRAGSNIILYRGTDYKYPYFIADDITPSDPNDADTDPDEHNAKESSQLSPNRVNNRGLVQGVGSPNRVRFQLPGEAEVSEEAERLLEGLGPRFSDWWGYEPLPVDADLLPAVVPGYRKPFRLLPYGVYPKLTNDEMTTLRRLGRPLPCHFALGRNRNHQGLAAAIVKLWEKCEIAKIAVKRGVQNTNSELMAEEIRRLTGGTLLSRDREFIVLYRGKDFLPPAVSSAIEERRKHTMQKVKATELQQKSILNINKTHKKPNVGPSEPMEPVSPEEAIRNTGIKLSMALEKKAEAEKLLEELEQSQKPEQADVDKEGITEEERYMMRKVGLRMKAFLLLGRRGVFDGTVENMHLHWKYRELVKIMCKAKSIEDVYHVARTLETESGGILVAVERVSKGYAIIMYRGKNYERPAIIRPNTLLSRRAALKRSIEAQRRESLKLHVLKLSEDIDQLKLQLDRDSERRALQPLDGSSNQQIELDVSTDSSLPNETDLIIDTSLAEEPHLNNASDGNRGGKTSDFVPNDEIKPEESHVSSPERIESFAPSMETVEGEADSSLGPTELPSRRPKSLSKGARLLLRKQALTMRKRPVLAIGRSNMVTGIAKAIKTHFKKHPLAIINVKGRAKGTSMQEMIFKLEQATGAVLVSQEPNKVILYRGWGDEEEQRRIRSSGREKQQHVVVSPELIAAIKLECGILTDEEDQDTNNEHGKLKNLV